MSDRISGIRKIKIKTWQIFVQIVAVLTLRYWLGKYMLNCCSSDESWLVKASDENKNANNDIPAALSMTYIDTGQDRARLLFAMEGVWGIEDTSIPWHWNTTGINTMTCLSRTLQIHAIWGKKYIYKLFKDQRRQADTVMVQIHMSQAYQQLQSIVHLAITQNPSNCKWRAKAARRTQSPVQHWFSERAPRRNPQLPVSPPMSQADRQWPPDVADVQWEVDDGEGERKPW